jgi:hypothetical protein
MSTQYDTRPATSQTHPSHRAPRPGQQHRSGYRVATIAIGSVIAAALVVLAAVGLIHHSATPAASTSAPASTSATSGSGSSTSPAVIPSASVKKLQQELGQLNYYEGPVDGVMGPQTTAAIKDLQRQANLPQTGSMDAATQKALDNYLVHGNNQMAG